VLHEEQQVLTDLAGDAAASDAPLQLQPCAIGPRAEVGAVKLALDYSVTATRPSRVDHLP
jgi:hypothetical protein